MKPRSNIRKQMQIYSQVLRLYPKRFQERFAKEMLQTFRDQLREEKTDLVFWINTLLDETGNVFKEQLNLWNGGESPVRKYSFGLLLSAIMVIAIVLTNIVFPQYGTDDYPAVGLMYLLFFVSFGITGYLSVNEKDNLIQGTKSGVIMGFTLMFIMVATFFVIDNLFLNIVSKQPEKIAYFKVVDLRALGTLLTLGC